MEFLKIKVCFIKINKPEPKSKSLRKNERSRCSINQKTFFSLKSLNTFTNLVSNCLKETADFLQDNQDMDSRLSNIKIGIQIVSTTS